ncbi:site-specific integrase [Siccirubricoccus sp. G192]|uniref:tyrosine-type recombinase/integrase n=1 Tax=Siccirubricoccus sp. G192 TaxID=2849651 RepID=UPI001C2C03A7|nr:site-specific integrase [Siccirubricoccus sp. G192]MBV1800057.1 site-specific integrase [Siccirubricoccus sp. G192]
MPAPRTRIGLREIRAMSPNETIFDGGTGSVPGFGARRRAGQHVSYFIMYRTRDGRQRRYTIGTHGAPWTPDAARAKAQQVLVAARIEGADPQADKKAKRSAATIGELCDMYMQDAEAGRLLTRRGIAKKPSTLLTDRSFIEAHIKPLLGRMKVPAVTREDVEHFMHQVAEGATRRRVKTNKKGDLSNVRGGRGVASRTVGLLGGIFTYAQRKRMVTEHPVRGVIRYADRQKERRLSDEEYAALGRGLAAAAELPKPRDDGKAPRTPRWPATIQVARFLALTGWRTGEALTLRWAMLDLPRRTARLPDTKTGESLRPLSMAACDLLRQIGPGHAAALVFPPARGDGKMSSFPKLFGRIVRPAGLPRDITPHVLRHSFASLAADLGCSELAIAALLGHRSGSITARYTHVADDVLLSIADRVAAATLRKMAGEGSVEVLAGPGVLKGVA